MYAWNISSADKHGHVEIAQILPFFPSSPILSLKGSSLKEGSMN